MAGAASGVVAFTVGVDPYGLFGTPRIPGWTAEKPAAADWSHLSKPYLVEAAHPATIVLGSSTVDIGIDPESPAWPAADRPVFNLGIFSGTPKTQLLHLQHALATTQPRLVLIGASFDDALILPRVLVREAADIEGGFEHRLRVGPDGRENPAFLVGRLQNLVFATLTMRSVINSAATLFAQTPDRANTQTPLGRNTGGRFIEWIGREGQFEMVALQEKTRVRELIEASQHPFYEVEPVAQAVVAAQDHGARVIVFIVPNHASGMEVFRQVGLTGAYQAWVKALLAAVKRVARQGTDVPVWDFGGFSRYTTEPVPAERDKTARMRWTFEALHFQPALGTLMIERMLGGDGPADLGARITEADLPARFAAYDAAQQEWVASHPADVARIQAAVRDAAAPGSAGRTVAASTANQR